MPTASDFFPSNYLRCADLGGKERIVTIDRVESSEFENDGRKQKKPVIHFKDAGIKPLVSNKTNFLLIAKICGENSNDWPGKQICLYPDVVPFKGQVQEAVRVRRPGTAPPTEMNDVVPF